MHEEEQFQYLCMFKTHVSGNLNSKTGFHVPSILEVVKVHWLYDKCVSHHELECQCYNICDLGVLPTLLKIFDSCNKQQKS